jgi:hypothetical protein
MADIQALEETMAAVEVAAKNGRWIQDEWFTGYDLDGEWCGTAGCFAGHRAFLDGYRVEATPNGRLLVKGGADPIQFAGDWASGRLRLSDAQAEELFRSGNQLDDLRRIVARIKAEVTEA